MNKIQVSFIAIGFVASILGCSELFRKDEVRSIGSQASANKLVTKIYYATDRLIDTRVNGNDRFTATRGKLSYGIAHVSIPRDHKMGELERPSLWRFEIKEDKDNHIVLLNAISLDRPTYYQDITKRMQAFDRKIAFIFVHGYRVSFEDAALRTGQMAYDLGFKGAPVFYSWPSQGKLAPYTFDEDAAAWSKANLEEFLREFAQQSSADEIYLIGHSMGTRSLTGAYMSLLQHNPELKSRFKEIILAAPDIDSDVFKRDIAPTLAASGIPITMYVSSKDKALLASKAVHNNARVGDTNAGVLVIPGIETIDATNVDTSFLGHSYIVEQRTLISDIYYLLNSRTRASKRVGLEPVGLPTAAKISPFPIQTNHL